MTSDEQIKDDLARRACTRLDTWAKDTISLYDMAELPTTSALAAILQALIFGLCKITWAFNLDPDSVAEGYKIGYDAYRKMKQKEESQQ